MSELTYAYFGGIEKYRDAEKFLHVKGVATSDTLDLDQQICDLAWLEAEMPDWLKSAGNIREMHTTSAVGKASELTQDGSKFTISAKVVDPTAALKVDEGVYTGLSIGIKGARVDKSAAALAKAPGGIINGGKIVEISLVDRPANPDAVLQLAKSVDGHLVKALNVVSDELDGENTDLENDAETATPCNTCNGTGVVHHNEDNENEEVPCPDCGGEKTSEDAQGLFGLADDANSESKSVGITELVKSLETILEKKVDGEWTHDPADIKAVTDGIANLLIAEIQEQMSGEDERYDIMQLSGALDTVLSWQQGEANEGETPAPFTESGDDTMAYVGLGVSADLIKSATADDASDEVKDELREAIKTALAIPEIDINKAVEAKVTEELTKFESRLATVEKMAAPRDYSLRATAVQNQTASEADGLEAKAATYRSTARLIDNDATTRIEMFKMADKAENEARELRSKTSTI